MKKSRCTFRAWLAIVLLLVAVLFPHHHHDGGVACIAVDFCAEEGRTADGHSGHSDRGRSDGTPCSGSLAVMKAAPAHARGSADLPLFFLPWESRGFEQPFISLRACGGIPSRPFARPACGFSKHTPRRGPPACFPRTAIG